MQHSRQEIWTMFETAIDAAGVEIKYGGSVSSDTCEAITKLFSEKVGFDIDAASLFPPAKYGHGRTMVTPGHACNVVTLMEQRQDKAPKAASATQKSKT